jgi:excisionase family DNA binding protein
MPDGGLESWMTLAEAAERYRIKHDRLRRAAIEGRLPARKVGSKTGNPWLVQAADVETFLRESKRGPKPRRREG